jgi:hypothetical protein
MININIDAETITLDSILHQANIDFCEIQRIDIKVLEDDLPFKKSETGKISNEYVNVEVYNKYGLVVFGEPYGDMDSKGEHRYLGVTLDGQPFPNPQKEQDVKGVSLFNFKNWIENPWNDKQVKQKGVQRPSIYDGDNGELRKQYEDNIRASLIASKDYSHRYKVNNLDKNGNDIQWYKYFHIVTPPTTYTKGLSWAWYKDNKGKLWYITLPLVTREEERKIVIEEEEPEDDSSSIPPVGEYQFIIPENYLTKYVSDIYAWDSNDFNERDKITYAGTPQYLNDNGSKTVYVSHSCSRPYCHTEHGTYTSYSYRSGWDEHGSVEYDPKDKTKVLSDDRYWTKDYTDYYHSDTWNHKWDNQGVFSLAHSVGSIAKDSTIRNNSFFTSNETDSFNLANVNGTMWLSRFYLPDRPTIASWKNNKPNALNEFNIGLIPSTSRGTVGIVNNSFSTSISANERKYIRDWNLGAFSNTTDYTTYSISNNNNNVAANVHVGVKVSQSSKVIGSIVNSGKWSGSTYKIIETDNDNIRFYPEYKMKYQDNTGAEYDIYMVGDKLREFKALNRHDIKITKGKTYMEGVFARDIRAKELSKRNYGYPVLPKAGAYNIKSVEDMKVTITSYIPRVKSSVASSWGYTDNSQKVHSDIVSDIYNDLKKEKYVLYVKGKYISPKSRDFSGRFGLDTGVSVSSKNNGSKVYNIKYDGTLRASSSADNILVDLDLKNRISGALERGTGTGGWYNEEVSNVEVVRYETVLTIRKPKAMSAISYGLGPSIVDNIRYILVVM